MEKEQVEELKQEEKTAKPSEEAVELVRKEMEDFADHLRSVCKDMKADLAKGEFTPPVGDAEKMSDKDKLRMEGSIAALDGAVKTLVMAYGVEPKSADEAFALVERDFMAFVDELTGSKKEEEGK